MSSVMSDRLMRQASCGCCRCSLKFFVVLATAYWKYRWSCLPFTWRFLSLRCYTHARTHSDLCMLDGLFSSVSFYFGASGSWLSEMASFSRTVAFFERVTVITYSHMSRDCLYGSRAGNPSLECIMQMKPLLPSFKRALDCCLALMSRTR